METKRLVAALKQEEKVNQGKIKRIFIHAMDNAEWVESLRPDGIAVLKRVGGDSQTNIQEGAEAMVPSQLMVPVFARGRPVS